MNILLMRKKDGEKGFTVVELLVTIGLIAIIGTFSLIGLSDYRNRQALVSAVGEIVAALRDTQNRSITQAEDSAWGIHFEFSTSTIPGIGTYAYKIFKGTAYSEAGVVKTISLSSVLRFTDLVIDPGCVGGREECYASKDVVFQPLSGFPDAFFSLTIASIRNPALVRRIEISAAGVISIFDVGPPSLSAIIPSSGVNVAPVLISQITGNNFQVGATASLERAGYTSIPGSGFTVTDSATLSSGFFDITGTAPGYWSVTVTNPDFAYASLPNGFLVTGPTLIVNSIFPSSGISGETVNTVTIGGEYFQNGATVRLTTTTQSIDGSGFAWVDSGTLGNGSLNLSGAAVGAWDVVVTNPPPDNQSGVKQAAFTVLPSSPLGSDSDFFDGGQTNINIGETTLGTLSTGFSNSNNLIIAVLQAYPSTLATSTGFSAYLKKGGLPLATVSSLRINAVGTGRKSASAVFVAKDTGSVASPAYSVTVVPFDEYAGGIVGEAKIIALNNLPNSSANFRSVEVGTSEILVASTSMPASGRNVILASVTFTNLDASSVNRINPGALKIVRGGVTLASNENEIVLEPNQQSGGVNYDSITSQNLLLIAFDSSAPGNSVYEVRAASTASGLFLVETDVQVAVINGLDGSFLDTNNVPLQTSETVIGTLAFSTSSVGDTVVISAFESKNTASTRDPNITAGDLRMKFGGVSQSSNEFTIDLVRPGASGQSPSFRGHTLLYKHPNAPGFVSYEFTASAIPNNVVNEETKTVILRIK